MATKSHNLLKIGDVALILGVHPNTLRKWEKQGKLNPKVRFGGTGTRYYDPVEVEALREGKEPGTYRTLAEIEEALGVDLSQCGWALPEPRYDLQEIKEKLPMIREYLESLC